MSLFFSKKISFSLGGVSHEAENGIGTQINRRIAAHDLGCWERKIHRLSKKMPQDTAGKLALVCLADAVAELHEEILAAADSPHSRLPFDDWRRYMALRETVARIISR